MIVSYVENHGWYWSRFGWWPLLLLSAFLSVPLLALDLVILDFTGIWVPVSLLPPFGLLIHMFRRLRRQWLGEPILCSRIFGLSGRRVAFVRRHEQPVKFRLLFVLEIVLWSSVVVAWSIAPMGALMAMLAKAQGLPPG